MKYVIVDRYNGEDPEILEDLAAVETRIREEAVKLSEDYERSAWLGDLEIYLICETFKPSVSLDVKIEWD